MGASTEGSRSPHHSPAYDTEAGGGISVPIRVLCLGNDLLADDALGIVVADRVRETLPDEIEVIDTMETGFGLMEYLLDARRMVVVDTVMTGTAPPGTVYVVCEEDVKQVSGGSPHYIGLFEGLELGRMLDLRVPVELVIVAVEGSDVRTVGGLMSEAVHDSIPAVVQRVKEIVHSFSQASAKEES
jgi:hydrogenase maturation protease